MHCGRDMLFQGENGYVTRCLMLLSLIGSKASSSMIELVYQFNNVLVSKPNYYKVINRD